MNENTEDLTAFLRTLVGAYDRLIALEDRDDVTGLTDAHFEEWRAQKRKLSAFLGKMVDPDVGRRVDEWYDARQDRRDEDQFVDSAVDGAAPQSSATAAAPAAAETFEETVPGRLGPAMRRQEARTRKWEEMRGLSRRQKMEKERIRRDRKKTGLPQSAAEVSRPRDQRRRQMRENEDDATEGRRESRPDSMFKAPRVRGFGPEGWAGRKNEDAAPSAA